VLTLGLIGLCASASGLVKVDCSIDANRFELTFSEKVIAARNAFFLSMCNATPVELVDFADPTLKGRLELASHLVTTHKGNYYPESAKLKNQGRTVVALIFETNGEIKNAAVIVSSGYDDLDKAAIAAYSSYKYEIPFKPDGHPVRVMVSPGRLETRAISAPLALSVCPARSSLD
jgi:TonB family protein